MKTFKYYVHPKSGARFEVKLDALCVSEGKKIVESMHARCKVYWAG